MFGYSLIETSRLKDLQSAYDNFESYYVGTPFDKRKTDKVIKKEAIQDLMEQNGVTEDKIKDILIDRKQNKIVVLLK